MIFWPALLALVFIFLAIFLVPEPWTGIAAGVGFLLGFAVIPLILMVMTDRHHS